MNIINKTSKTQTITTGRFSDGSDRQKIIITTYLVKVTDGTKTINLTFDHNPTDQEVTDVFVSVTGIEVPPTVEDLATKITQLQEDNLILMDVLATMYEDMSAKGTV